ncbi:MAG: DHHA1 domain-containing protein [Patescibacteria group bacterium]
MKNIVILYHADCPDGFGAAWAAWKKFGKKAEYIAVFHQQPIPKGLKNKEIYLVDFCYPISEMKTLKKEAASVTVIDHHITANSAIKIADNYLYKNSNSGSVLSWKYFHPKKSVPKLLLHIEDIDLWRFKLPFTREIIEALESFDFDFRIWDKIAADINNSKKFKKYVMDGKIILRYQKEILNYLLRQADKVKFNGYEVLAVNSPVFNSELGHLLSKKKSSFGVVWYRNNHSNIFSLRSDGKVDVSKIAKKYGGGGHKSAAGFSLDIKKGLPWKYIKN